VGTLRQLVESVAAIA